MARKIMEDIAAVIPFLSISGQSFKFSDGDFNFEAK